ncbi:MAG: hypothetical protein COA79_21525 [Planctomycetota bacterium]|nr:MAG: hypothetical protein COA79_21525 [Planctomycetota bacterium]
MSRALTLTLSKNDLITKTGSSNLLLLSKIKINILTLLLVGSLGLFGIKYVHSDSLFNQLFDNLNDNIEFVESAKINKNLAPKEKKIAIKVSEKDSKKKCNSPLKVSSLEINIMQSFKNYRIDYTLKVIERTSGITKKLRNDVRLDLNRETGMSFKYKSLSHMLLSILKPLHLTYIVINKKKC